MAQPSFGEWLTVQPQERQQRARCAADDAAVKSEAAASAVPAHPDTTAVVHELLADSQQQQPIHNELDISVITPTFRRPRLLQDTIRSVLSQSDVNLEMLVVDDSPEGSAAEVVQQLGDHRVRYLKIDVPSGGTPSIVRNFAWPQSRGRILHFLDDDDLVDQGAYAAVVREMAIHPSIGVAFGVIKPFGDDARVLDYESKFFADAARRARLYQRIRCSPRLLAGNLLFKNSLFVGGGCFIRRRCMETIGGYDPHCKLMEGLDLYTRAIRRFGYLFLDRPILHYRTGTPSLLQSSRARESEGLIAIQNSFDRIYDNYKAENGRIEFLCLQTLMNTVMKYP